jgi:hypothetical protein
MDEVVDAVEMQRFSAEGVFGDTVDGVELEGISWKNGFLVYW